ncbi:MAG: HNH endonuclease [Acidimicrobiales bacterium]|nr:HNH endonuclease [Acidimicrobiales bacterium]
MASDDLLTERLLRIIDEGRRTATYKLALLSALIDAAATHPGETEIGTRELAALVVDIYYPQTRFFVAYDGIERELRQISAKGSPVLRAMLRLRLQGDTAGCRSAADARRRVPDEYERALNHVEDTFVRYPIPLLQVVGSQSRPFLYEVDWPEGTTVASLRREGRDRLRFMPGVPDRLVVLGPLLRPLIELHWVRDVAKWTGVSTQDEQLRTHLFGTDRVTFPSGIRDGLSLLQDGRCFYCDERLVRAPQVDHFLAWARWPNDAIENLVAADGCNGFKSDHLAAPAHLERWMHRVQSSSDDLAEIAESARWLSDGGRSSALVTSTYTHVPPGTPLWVAGREFVDADRDALRELVGA